MKFRANKLELKKLFNGNTEIVIQIEDKNNKIANQISSKKELLKSDLEVSIDKWRNRRSGGHNRLFWDMCEYLSGCINDPLISPYIIYRQLIREYGVSTIYPVEDELLDMVVRDWENRGDGWITQIQRKSKIDENRTVVKFWYGSSIYNSKQFWKLVEGLKQMCKENDVNISHYDKQLQVTMMAFEDEEKAFELRKKQQIAKAI
ncbi:MAG: hypothetical protein ACI4PF_06340 [Christensenellales bacterium]